MSLSPEARRRLAYWHRTHTRRKRCTRCGRELPAGEFHRDTSKPGGLQSRCKECRHEARM